MEPFVTLTPDALAVLRGVLAKHPGKVVRITHQGFG